jgi:hypothetical protein
MKTGRELDALIAEKVMGWTDIEEDESDPNTRYSWNEAFIGLDPTAPGCFRSIPCYSTDMAAAWEVLEKMQAQGYRWCLLIRDELKSDTRILPYAEFLHYGKYAPGKVDTCVFAEDESMPLAICLAALRAVGGQP